MFSRTGPGKQLQLLSQPSELGELGLALSFHKGGRYQWGLQKKNLFRC